MSTTQVPGSGGGHVLREEHGVISGENSIFVIRADEREESEPFAAPWSGNTLVSVDNDDELGGDLPVHTSSQFGSYDVTTRLLDGSPGARRPIVEIGIQPAAALVATELLDDTPTMAWSMSQVAIGCVSVPEDG